MSIPFTQYLRPNGRTRPVEFDTDPTIEAMAMDLIAHGAHFDAEVLTTGHVSLTCERDDEEGETGVLASELIDNGPGMKEAVDRLVTQAHTKLSEEESR